MSPSFDFATPDHFTTGTVGPPGRRTFYLQIGAAGSVASFTLEKQQVGALADYLASVLADLPEPEAEPLPAPQLAEPLVPEWTIGGIGIAYDEDSDRVLLIVHELTSDDDADPEEPDDLGEGATARVRLTRAQVASFIDRAQELVAAGRPLCPFCGLPDGPDGHVCPRAN